MSTETKMRAQKKRIVKSETNEATQFFYFSDPHQVCQHIFILRIAGSFSLFFCIFCIAFSPFFLPNSGQIFFDFDPCIYLPKPSKVPESCSRFFLLNHCVGSFAKPFQRGFKFLLRGLPGSHGLFENLPDFFLLETFLFQENVNFFAFSFLGGCRPVQSSSLCPLHF